MWRQRLNLYVDGGVVRRFSNSPLPPECENEQRKKVPTALHTGWQKKFETIKCGRMRHVSIEGTARMQWATPEKPERVRDLQMWQDAPRLR